MGPTFLSGLKAIPRRFYRKNMLYNIKNKSVYIVIQQKSNTFACELESFKSNSSVNVVLLLFYKSFYDNS